MLTLILIKSYDVTCSKRPDSYIDRITDQKLAKIHGRRTRTRKSADVYNPLFFLLISLHKTSISGYFSFFSINFTNY